MITMFLTRCASFLINSAPTNSFGIFPHNNSFVAHISFCEMLFLRIESFALRDFNLKLQAENEQKGDKSFFKVEI